MKQNMWVEAIKAFYEWEEATGQTDLGDEERLIWCEGYIYCMEKQNENQTRQVR